MSLLVFCRSSLADIAIAVFRSFIAVELGGGPALKRKKGRLKVVLVDRGGSLLGSDHLPDRCIGQASSVDGAASRWLAIGKAE